MERLFDIRYIYCCIAMAICGGCATLSEDECRTANWRAIGYEDGSQGRPADYLAQHRRACAEYGVAPELEPYRIGREQGLRNYCQSGRGYSEGLNGTEYRHVCPRDMEPAFMSGYQAGRRIYLIEREVYSLDSKIERQQKELERVRKELETERDKEQIRALARKEGALENEIRDMEREKIQKATQAQSLREAAMNFSAHGVEVH